MTLLEKIVATSELPLEWQKELQLSDTRKVRIEITEVEAEPIDTARSRFLVELENLKPVTIRTDATTFIRAGRAYTGLEGRSS